MTVLNNTKTLFVAGLAVAASVAVGTPAQAARFGDSNFVLDARNNNVVGRAQNLDPYFALSEDPIVTDSDIAPHVTVAGHRNRKKQNSAFDFFSFTVSEAGTRGIFDIDFGAFGNDEGRIDTELFLFDESRTLLAQNDDFWARDRGSVSGLDSFVEYLFDTAGTYFLGVGEFPSWFDGSPRNRPLEGNAPDDGDTYLLHVSLAAPPSADVPEPAAIAGLVAAGGALAGLRRRRRGADEAAPSTP